jgi:hypothetical protein
MNCPLAPRYERFNFKDCVTGYEECREDKCNFYNVARKRCIFVTMAEDIEQIKVSNAAINTDLTTKPHPSVL